jgi:hypothetical protein
MAKYLFEVQEKNRLAQKGLLKRFSLNCMGHQETIEEMRAEKAAKYTELKDKKDSSEYEEWFLRYRPTDNVKTNKVNNKTSKILNKRKGKTRKHKKKKRGLFF